MIAPYTLCGTKAHESDNKHEFQVAPDHHALTIQLPFSPNCVPTYNTFQYYKDTDQKQKHSYHTEYSETLTTTHQAVLQT